MRKKESKIEYNRIHPLEVDALKGVIGNIEEILGEDHPVINKNTLQTLGNTLAEVQRVYIKLVDYYCNLLKSYEDV